MPNARDSGWFLTHYAPDRTEFVDDAAWRTASERFQKEYQNGVRSMRLMRLTRTGGISMPGGYDVLEEYRVPVDTVEISKRPCIFCGKPAKNAKSFMGFTHHGTRKCYKGWIKDDQAEELLIVAERLQSKRKRSDLRYPPAY